MELKSQIKLALVITLFLSIIVYHIFDYFYIDLSKASSISFLNIYKTSQLTVTAALFVVLAYTKWIARLLLRESYIGGHYKGLSNDYKYCKDGKGSDVKPTTNIELFTIGQNVFDTRITGWSWKNQSGQIKLVSTWEGRLVKQEGNTFVFAVELTTDSGEYGILKATFNGTEVHGFYFSGEPNTKFAASFSAKKVPNVEIKNICKELQKT
jgi:hypothetical protein